MKVLAVLLAALLGSACSDGELLAATQIVAAVRADPGLTETLTRLELAVYAREDEASAVSAQTLPLGSAPSGHSLPLSFAVVKPKAGADSFVLAVAGFVGDEKRVEQKLTVRFQDRTSQLVDVYLSDACAGKICTPASRVCYAATQAGTSAGDCGPILDAPLERVEPGAELTGIVVTDASRANDAGTDAAPAPAHDAEVHEDAEADDATTPDAGPPEDPCASSMCAPAGSCVIEAGAARCACASGFEAIEPLACKPRDHSIAAAEGHTCAIKTDGRVACWGYYGWDTKTLSSPTVVEGVNDAVWLVAGKYHDCAITTDQTVVCWGDNHYGQLGTGEVGTLYGAPVKPRGLKDIVRLYAGETHTCAVDASGALFCWGAEGVGTGTQEIVWSPTAVPGMERVESVALGVGGHTCATKQGGDVYCWGTNDQWQVGDGTYTYALAPLKVPGVAGASEVIAGEGWTCALTPGGLWCWGFSAFKDKGNVPATVFLDAQTPKLVSTPPGMRGFVAGGQHYCARDANDQFWCRGFGGWGQLGNETFTSSPTEFVQVQGLANVDALVGGWYHNCARTRDAQVFCWGGNDKGQIGDGTADDAWLPVRVVGL